MRFVVGGAHWLFGTDEGTWSSYPVVLGVSADPDFINYKRISCFLCKPDY